MRKKSMTETVARFYAGRVRDRFTAWQPKRRQLTITGPSPTDSTVTLRCPRISDAPAWRQLRLQNQAVIEPFWTSSNTCWEQRHTETVWIRECLHSRAVTTAGHALPMVIEVDGRFAGQCNFEWIDMHNGTAEVGIWVDSAHGRSGIGITAATLILEHGFAELGLHRISAPISITNVAAKRLVTRIGLIYEGTMSGYLDVGGRRTDHELWAITADRFARIRDAEQRNCR